MQLLRMAKFSSCLWLNLPVFVQDGENYIQSVPVSGDATFLEVTYEPFEIEVHV